MAGTNLLFTIKKSVSRLLDARYIMRNSAAIRALAQRDFSGPFPFDTPVFHSQGVNGPGRHYYSCNYSLWKELNSLFYSCSAPPSSGKDDLTILTCTNDPTAGSLQESLQHIGFSEGRFLRLGADIRDWTHYARIPALARSLELVSTPFVLFCDSHDVLVTDCSSIVDRFLSCNCEMLFNAEKRLSHPLGFNKKIEEGIALSERDELPEYRYLNAGVWAARTEFARAFFRECARIGPHPADPSDDQLAIKNLFPSYHPRIRLDYDRRLVQTLQFAEFGELHLRDGPMLSKTGRIK